MTAEQIAFGSGLRRERERQKISLASVAQRTKIQQALLCSLERGDASRWPAGIYRRAFLRAYTDAIGVPPETTVAAFVRLFPESGAAIPDGMEALDAGGDLRLTLARDRQWSARSLALQVGAALLDAGAIFAISAAGRFALGESLWSFWSLAGIVAVCYYSIATASVGRSPALWVMRAISSRRTTLSRQVPQDLSTAVDRFSVLGSRFSVLKEGSASFRT